MIAQNEVTKHYPQQVIYHWKGLSVDNSNMHVFLIQGVVLFFSWILKNHIFFLKFQNIFNYNLLWLNHMSFLVAFLDSLDNFLFRNVYFYGCRISNKKETINWMKNGGKCCAIVKIAQCNKNGTTSKRMATLSLFQSLRFIC